MGLRFVIGVISLFSIGVVPSECDGKMAFVPSLSNESVSFLAAYKDFVGIGPEISDGLLPAMSEGLSGEESGVSLLNL